MSPTPKYSFFDFTPKVEDRNKWLLPIPAIAVGALGAAYIPNFALGLGIGACQFIVSSTLGILKEWISPAPDEKNSAYIKHLRENIALLTILGPVGEEVLFRGILQPLLLVTMLALCSLSLADIFSETTLIMLLIPLIVGKELELYYWMIVAMVFIYLNLNQLIHIALFGATINPVSLAAMCVTAVLFGLAHLANPHKNAPLQAMTTTLAGITFGMLALQYGLWVPIAAHMMNNTLCAVSNMMFLDEEVPIDAAELSQGCRA